MDESEDRVILMTLHAAKGLEFPKVYLSGMEEGLFPSMMAMQEDPEALEEERRLCYVGITRAEQELMLTAARQRMIKGETRYERPSRFLQELPEEFVERLEQDNSIYSRRRVQSEYENSELPWNNRSEGISLFGQKSSAYTSKTVKTAPEKPSYGSVYTIRKSGTLDYGPGDRVNHMRFGNGTVKSIVDGGKDYEVTVEFDTMGIRKMFASFAKLKKV